MCRKIRILFLHETLCVVRKIKMESGIIDAMRDEYKNKIRIIIVLAIAIVIGLLVLYFGTPKGTKEEAVATPTPTATPTVEVISTPEPTVEPTPVPTPTVDVTSDDSLTKVVNLAHLVDENYVPSDLRTVNVHVTEAQELRDEAATNLEYMFQAAINDHIYLKLVSGYRSYQLQKDLYNYYISIRGQAFADSVDAHPGASEHQLGLGVDIGCWNGACELEYCFTYYDDYTWLQEHAHEYGFVERYPDGKSDITRIAYSPWHFRYLGVEEATKVYESGLTLEEYYGVSAYE